MQPKQSPQRAVVHHPPTGVFLAVGLLLLLATTAQAQTLTVLHNFTGADGNSPYAGVTFDQQGRI